jgi:hypothetical protein
MKWFKAGAWGFVVGSIVTMIVGFSWGGWTTGGTAIERANAAVIAALVPVCIEKSKADPARAKKLGALRALTSSYQQRDAVLEGGWATVGTAAANRDVAEACASKLVEVAAK